ncbi:putative nuclease HARBI1 [Anopheles darlingi]|uniref:putative nuclease HARBI1 n=1 Tax=Anopheles darlingi TaxID=43151 RepID=UPI0021005E6F|nr:putative nuclease HARBI1 [Anopheles darlingi]
MHPKVPKSQLKICVSLRFRASGSYQLSIGNNTIIGLSQPKLPSTTEEWLRVSNRFERKYGFPHAIGALDGKHVAVRAPKGSGNDHFNYKGFHSIVLLAIVDADGHFMYIDVGGKGSVSDGGIFNNSEVHRRSGSVERNFNNIHTRARITVERSFGILTSIFRRTVQRSGLNQSATEKQVLDAVCHLLKLKEPSAVKLRDSYQRTKLVEIFLPEAEAKRLGRRLGPLKWDGMLGNGSPQERLRRGGSSQ